MGKPGGVGAGVSVTWTGVSVGVISGVIPGVGVSSGVGVGVGVSVSVGFGISHNIPKSGVDCIDGPIETVCSVL
jgi:hypothetical protein